MALRSVLVASSAHAMDPERLAPRMQLAPRPMTTMRPLPIDHKVPAQAQPYAAGRWRVAAWCTAAACPLVHDLPAVVLQEEEVQHDAPASSLPRGRPACGSTEDYPLLRQQVALHEVREPFLAWASNRVRHLRET